MVNGYAMRVVDDPLAIARERLSKAEARVQKLEKQLESARSEMNDLQTTVRVMAEITGESSAMEPVEPGLGRQKAIIQLLPVGEENGASPSELYETYSIMFDHDPITIDTFRTTLWRMKNSMYILTGVGIWAIRGNDGKYWKIAHAEKKEAPAKAEASNSKGPVTGRERGYPPSTPEGSIPSGSTHVPASFDADLDDDVPF